MMYVGKDFLSRRSFAQGLMPKIDIWIFMKLKSYFIIKETVWVKKKRLGEEVAQRMGENL